MSNIQLFQFEKQEIRFVDGKPVANDVAKVLGYSDPAKTISTKVEKEYKGLTRVVTPGGIQSVTVLEKPGIYQLIFGSKLPSAKVFQKWVFEEVLPSIRKDGSYSVLVEEDEIKKDIKTECEVIATITTSILLPNIHQILVSGVVANNIAKAYPQYKLVCEESKKALPPLEVKEQLLTVTELASIWTQRTGSYCTAIALNKKLAAANLQYRNGVDSPRWLPTDLGKEYGMVVLETAKPRDKTIQVLKWFSTVVDYLILNVDLQ
jgi:prophage antirepressor-like protein